MIYFTQPNSLLNATPRPSQHTLDFIRRYAYSLNEVKSVPNA